MIGYLDEDGTATVTGSALPADQAATACAHVEELARAAKRAGHPGRIGPLRADIYLGLLDGRWQHCNRDQIIADLLTRATSDTDDGADPDNPARSDQPVDPAVGGRTASRDECGSAAADRAPGGGTPVHPAAAGGNGSGTHQDGTPSAGWPRTGSEGTGSEGAAQPVRRTGVELRVGLSTLLGQDRHPGEVAGWGPVTAEVSCGIVTAQRAAEWRFALTDPAGQLLLAGITRRRPPGTAPAGELPPCRGGIVELQLPAALLTEFAANLDACGEWAGVVADLAAQYTRYIQNGRRGPAGQDPTARFAGAALRRHVQIRDRSCVYPGCRHSARSADLDHTVDHTYGGPTVDSNSGPLCRHDHRLKHIGRWLLHQPEAGHFTWTSPLGRTYRTQPAPITNDLPGPQPRPDRPDYPCFVIPDDDSPILERPPPQPGPQPPARLLDPDEPPPF
ncbi:MAG: HNH endonuclease signature motif containing protein [Pseudonocardiaceae bacterium]